MLSKSLQEIINSQIKHELYSAYLYLSMSAYFESKNLKGFAHWMSRQNEEEVKHARKFYDYIYDRNGRVTLQAIEQPPIEFASPLAIFEQSLAHEQKVTGLINGIYDLARTENDYATQEMLQWFVAEQVEEEKSASEIVEKLKMVGDHATAIYFLDKELGKRE